MKFSFSIVSHNQWHLCKSAILSIINNINSDYEIILTLNIEEKFSIPASWAPLLKVIKNSIPKGFGKNHNNAFKHSSGEYFIIVNPDTEIVKWEELKLNSKSLYSPIIINPDGSMSDFKRSYPTIVNLLRRKLLFKTNEKLDWFAGVFLIIHRDFFKDLNGFDQFFFMYLEDTDLSLRVQNHGGELIVLKSVMVSHKARRTSNKKFKYFKYHLVSLIKFYLKHYKKLYFFK